MVTLMVIGLLLVLSLLIVGLFILRRFVLTRTVGTFDCSLRQDSDSGDAEPSWILGVARYEVDRLDWFRVFSMAPRPGRVLNRSQLTVIERRAPTDDEKYSVMPGSLIVRCSYGSRELELAMSQEAFNGFATWLESAPPGTPVFTT
jgi:hypothetical protein